MNLISVTFTLRCCIWIRRKYISLAYGMKPLNERYFAIDMEFYSLSRLYGSGPRDHKTQWCETLSGTVRNKIQSFFITLFEQKIETNFTNPIKFFLIVFFNEQNLLSNTSCLLSRRFPLQSQYDYRYICAAVFGILLYQHIC